jgi:hypothetical protein
MEFNFRAISPRYPFATTSKGKSRLINPGLVCVVQDLIALQQAL